MPRWCTSGPRPNILSPSRKRVLSRATSTPVSRTGTTLSRGIGRRHAPHFLPLFLLSFPSPASREDSFFRHGTRQKVKGGKQGQRWSFLSSTFRLDNLCSVCVESRLSSMEVIKTETYSRTCERGGMKIVRCSRGKIVTMSLTC